MFMGLPFKGSAKAYQPGKAQILTSAVINISTSKNPQVSNLTEISAKCVQIQIVNWGVNNSLKSARL
jgi:hypothetical protein